MGKLGPASLLCLEEVKACPPDRVLCTMFYGQILVRKESPGPFPPLSCTALEEKHVPARI